MKNKHPYFYEVKDWLRDEFPALNTNNLSYHQITELYNIYRLEMSYTDISYEDYYSTIVIPVFKILGVEYIDY